MRPSILRGSARLPKSSYLIAAAAAVLLAGCSSSFERFAGGNPSDEDPVYTASVPRQKVAQADIDDGVESRPLAKAPVQRTENQASNAGNYKPVYRQPSYDQAKVYKQPSYREQETAEADAPAPAPAQEIKPRYRAAAAAAVERAGTVTVEPGMTLYSIAKANGLTVSQLARANSIAPPYGVNVGQTLRIPGVAHASAPAPSFQPKSEQTAVVDPAPATVPAVRKPAAKGGTHTVSTGETLFSLGRKYGVHPYAIADLNGLPHATALRLGQSVKIPAGGQTIAAAPAPEAEDEDAAPAKLKTAEPVEAQADDIPRAEPVPAPKQITEQIPAADPGLPAFRWPVKGKVISEYGAKPNGLRNEGINIAVPEGTSVRAAESGVVAYAGNELKGYGNLVLVRHEGGWVTAYAHNKELFVKRGDAVKRGDVIAKAGKTGSVETPQLHFEVRKGATAMNPIKFLGASTASN